MMVSMGGREKDGRQVIHRLCPGEESLDTASYRQASMVGALDLVSQKEKINSIQLYYRVLNAQ